MNPTSLVILTAILSATPALAQDNPAPEEESAPSDVYLAAAIALANNETPTQPISRPAESVDQSANSPLTGRPLATFRGKGWLVGAEHVGVNKMSEFMEASLQEQRIDLARDRVRAGTVAELTATAVAFRELELRQTLAEELDGDFTITSDLAVSVGSGPATVLAADGQLGVGGYGMMPGVSNWWNGLGYAQAYSSPPPQVPGNTGSGASPKPDEPEPKTIYPSVGGDR